MKTCPNCHAAVQDDALFCTSCGTPLEQSAAPTEPLTSNQPEQPDGFYQPSAAPQPEPTQPQYQAQSVQPQTPPVQQQVPPQYNAPQPAPNMAVPKHEFFEAYKLYWKNYTNFTDRTRCSDYWYVVLMNLLISLGVSMFSFIPYLGYVLSAVWSLATIIPGLALTVRRLKDTGKDWPYIFFCLIPIVGWIIIIVFCAQDSEMGPNQFGPSPKYPYAGGTYAPQQPQYNPTQPNMQNDYAQNNQYPPQN